MRAFELLNSVIFGPGLSLTVLLCGAALMFKLKSVFYFPKKIRSLEKSRGDMPPAKAMCMALGGTLGVGNIAGVASALYIGGSGAIFWMWISAFFAMFIKYAETVLALKHRRYDGEKHGGAYYYMCDSGHKKSAILFSVLCIVSSLGIGSSVQSNSAAVCLEKVFGIDRWLSGIILGMFVFFTVSGGLSRIVDTVSAAVPILAIIYGLVSLYIIFSNIELMPNIMKDIFSSALGKDAFGGGIFAFLTSRTLTVGVTRGIVSNEAGCGTAPIAHSTSDSAEPAVQGLFGMLEVFIDTVVLCSLTAFAVLIAKERGVTLQSDGMECVLSAFGRFLPFSDIFISVSVTLFAIATMLCWFYYGSESIGYLFKKRVKIYVPIYCFAVFIGAVMSESRLWGFSDFSISFMTVINIFEVMRSSIEIKRETDRYFKNNDRNFVGQQIEKKSMM